MARSPRALLGQSGYASVPRGDVVVYLHQVRPLRRGRSVTMMYDTIGLRYGGTRATRLAKRAFLRAVASLSTQILTLSEQSRVQLENDLRLAPGRIAVVRPPLDLARAARVGRLRAELEREDVLLYVGRFFPHKNLPRLAAAFRASHFAAGGGRLLLVGGSRAELERLRATLAPGPLERIELRGTCSDAELDRLLATCRALVAPALEEGFGLSAFEAAAAGVPVAASTAGAMPELPHERVRLFDPTDTAAITVAIDDVVARPPAPPVAERAPGELAAGVVRAVARSLADAPS